MYSFQNTRKSRSGKRNEYSDCTNTDICVFNKGLYQNLFGKEVQYIVRLQFTFYAKCLACQINHAL
jgi:hypothetical protein